MQCSGPTALAGPHSNKQMRIGGTQQHSRCRHEDIQFLFGSTFFLCNLPRMRQRNHLESQAGRRFDCVQNVGDVLAAKGLQLQPVIALASCINAVLPSTSSTPSRPRSWIGSCITHRPSSSRAKATAHATRWKASARKALNHRGSMHPRYPVEAQQFQGAKISTVSHRHVHAPSIRGAKIQKNKLSSKKPSRQVILIK